MAEEEEAEGPALLRVAMVGYPWRMTELTDPALSFHSYAAVRARVETEVVRVRCAPLTTGYALLLPCTARGGLATLTAQLLASAGHLREHLAHVGYLMRAKPTAELRRVPFAPAWISDPNARTIDSIVFDPARPAGGAFWEAEEEEAAAAAPRPPLRQRRRLIWNNWPGLCAARLPAAPPPLPPPLLPLWAPIRRHILEVLFSGVEADAEWFLDYLGAIVQRPWVKTGVVVLFTGAQGAGKNTVLDFFRERILGEAITAQIQKPQQGLLDRFGALHLHRILVQIDEADRLGPMEAGLKHLVTADTVSVQQKFKDRVLVKNYLNFIMTTNGLVFCCCCGCGGCCTTYYFGRGRSGGGG
jgi:hypothetical protein